MPKKKATTGEGPDFPDLEEQVSEKYDFWFAKTKDKTSAAILTLASVVNEVGQIHHASQDIEQRIHEVTEAVKEFASTMAST